MSELKQKIEIRSALKAFELIRLHGEAENVDQQSVYRLYGVSAASDFDGYNIQLSDARVKLHIYFHNKFECNYDSNAALDVFIGKLESIIAHYESST